MMLFVLTAFLFFAVIAWRDFVFALALFSLLLPSYLIRFSLGPLPSTALEGFFFVLLIVWASKKRKVSSWKKSIHAFSKTMFFWPGMLLLLGATLSIFVATDTLAALGIWKAYFIEPFLFAWILHDQVKTKQDWKKIFIGLGGMVIALTLVSVIQSITGWWSPTWEWTLPESRRITSLFTSPNALGLVVGPITLLYLGWFWLAKKENKKKKILLFLAFVILCGMLSVYLAVSRGAIIAMVAGVVFILWRIWSKQGVAILGIIGLSIILLLPSLRQPLTDIASFQVDSGQSRLALYTGTGTLLKQSPILGLGLASFADRFEEVRIGEFTEELIYPHNLFLNFWAETSLFGLMAILWIAWVITKSTWKEKSFAMSSAIIAALIVVFVHGFVDVPYFKNDLAMMTWILLSALTFFIQEKEMVKEA